MTSLSNERLATKIINRWTIIEVGNYLMKNNIPKNVIEYFKNEEIDGETLVFTDIKIIKEDLLCKLTFGSKYKILKLIEELKIRHHKEMELLQQQKLQQQLQQNQQKKQNNYLQSKQRECANEISKNSQKMGINNEQNLSNYWITNHAYKKWSIDEDSVLVHSYYKKHQTIAQLAKQHQRSQAAIYSRLWKIKEEKSKAAIVI